MAEPTPTETGRLERTRAPYLYEGLMWAAVSALLLGAATFVMVTVNVILGLAVLVVCLVAITFGGRAILRHHRAEDERHERERSEYNERMGNLLRRSQAAAAPGPSTLADSARATDAQHDPPPYR